LLARQNRRKVNPGSFIAGILLNRFCQPETSFIPISGFKSGYSFLN
jgi:hypothetical protein